MRAIVECNTYGCEGFGEVFVDEPEASAWFKTKIDPIVVSQEASVPLQEHHIATRPAGGVAGHTGYRVRFVGEDEVGFIARNTNKEWTYRRSMKSTLDMLSTTVR